jgi:MORN repeat variant
VGPFWSYSCGMSVEDVGTVTPPAPPAAPATPERPSGVPAEAEWEQRLFEWQVVPRDAEGRAHGLVRSWRSDGELSKEYEHCAGYRHGAFRRFHPDGSVAREGFYVDGRPHGLTIAHGYDGPGVTHEPMQSCCVPAGAWQLQHDFDQGRLQEVRWYDRDGRHITESGAPHPPRPAGVLGGAIFEEGADQWSYREYDANGSPHGVWRRWTREGVLRERDEFRASKAHGLFQRWDETGALREESEWREGLRGGRYRRVGVPEGLYADPRVHEERGAFERDQSVGTWTLLDAGGATVATLDLGAVLDDEGLLASPVFAAAAPDATAESWLARARALEGEGRIAEALIATARAAAAARDAAPLRGALARLALTRGAETAQSLAADLVKRADGRLDLLANALAAGADAPSILRALGSSLAGREDAGLALVDAALLLAPDRSDCRVTRALLAIHLGRPEVALAEIASLPEDHAEQRTFLESYVRVVFSTYPFAPAGLEPRTAFPDVPEGPQQPLAKVRAQLQKYATRLGLVRAAVVARLPAGAAPGWLPPDVSDLLPEGPVALETWEFEEVIVDDPDPDAPPDAVVSESEAKLVTVDERLGLDAATPVPTLLRQARREWNGLCWMCWATGLARVALPDAVRAPADFRQAAGLSIERLWRCRDRLVTGGLRAMTQGVPGFRWEGIEIDLMPPILAEIAADEFREMRAVFYWLCDEGVQSPWQDNVRTPD